MPDPNPNPNPNPNPDPNPNPSPNPAPAPESWFSKFDGETKGYVELKGWKDPSEVVVGYKNLEKLVGTPADQLLRLPKADDAEGMMKVYDRLGRPAKAEEYKLPQAAHRTPESLKEVQGWFHEAGLTSSQAAKVVEKWDGFVAQQAQKAADADKMQATEGVANLNKAWGAAFQKNSAIVDGVAREFGMTAEQLGALRKVLGTEGSMKFLYNIGQKLGEDTFIAQRGGPQGFGGVMSPDQAKARIEALKADADWAQKYINGGTKEREEMDRLQAMAYPEPKTA